MYSRPDFHIKAIKRQLTIKDEGIHICCIDLKLIFDKVKRLMG